MILKLLVKSHHLTGDDVSCFSLSGSFSPPFFFLLSAQSLLFHSSQPISSINIKKMCLLNISRCSALDLDHHADSPNWRTGQYGGTSCLGQGNLRSLSVPVESCV